MERNELFAEPASSAARSGVPRLFKELGIVNGYSNGGPADIQCVRTRYAPERWVESAFDLSRIYIERHSGPYRARARSAADLASDSAYIFDFPWIVIWMALSRM